MHAITIAMVLIVGNPHTNESASPSSRSFQDSACYKQYVKPLQECNNVTECVRYVRHQYNICANNL
jgi:hypothetical protein